MSPKHQRLLFAVFGIGFLIAASLLILNRFNEHLVFFFSPTELAEKAPPPEQYIRIGGLVKPGSLQQDGKIYRFTVTDYNTALPIRFTGAPPALFREGQGVVAEGYYINGTFKADRLLAKHDENYMPPEVANALRENGHWQQPAGKTLP